MKIGVIKELKDRENRVALTPNGAAELIGDGHQVFVEHEAGVGSGYPNQFYADVGAVLTETEAAWQTDLVLKVKEPLAEEYGHLAGQMVFTFFHLAGAPSALTDQLLVSKTTAIAYETLEDAQGRLPLLAPMSAIAGSMATLMGSYYLAQHFGGKGLLLGKVLGECQGKVVVIGDGVVGQHAAQVAIGMGANVWVAGIQSEGEALIKQRVSERVHYFLSTPENRDKQLLDADLVIGAVLLHGEHAPYVVSEAMLKQMQPGTVMVDVAIDQGGCFETSRPTSHSDPIYSVHGIVHYCVTNMPAAYPRTSTIALTNATLPYICDLANSGLQAFVATPSLAKAVNTYDGSITCEPVAISLQKMDKFCLLSERL